MITIKQIREKIPKSIRFYPFVDDLFLFLKNLDDESYWRGVKEGQAKEAFHDERESFCFQCEKTTKHVYKVNISTHLSICLECQTNNYWISLAEGARSG